MVESYLAYVLKIKHLLIALEAPKAALGEKAYTNIDIGQYGVEGEQENYTFSGY